MIELERREPKDLIQDDETTKYYDKFVKPFEDQWLKNVIEGSVATTIVTKPQVISKSSTGGVVKVKDPIRILWEKFVPVGELMDEDGVFAFYEELKVDPSTDLVVFAVSLHMKA